MISLCKKLINIILFMYIIVYLLNITNFIKYKKIKKIKNYIILHFTFYFFIFF